MNDEKALPRRPEEPEGDAPPRGPTRRALMGAAAASAALFPG